jgi:hypothetical protein
MYLVFNQTTTREKRSKLLPVPWCKDIVLWEDIGHIPNLFLVGLLKPEDN